MSLRVEIVAHQYTYQFIDILIDAINEQSDFVVIHENDSRVSSTLTVTYKNYPAQIGKYFGMDTMELLSHVMLFVHRVEEYAKNHNIKFNAPIHSDYLDPSEWDGPVDFSGFDK